MGYEYQSRKFIPIEAFTGGKRRFLELEKMLKPGQILVVDLKGAFFDFKGENSPNYYKHAVYAWDGTFPRFLRCIDRIVRNVNGEERVAAYRCLS